MNALDRVQIIWMASGAALAAARLVVLARRPTDLLTEKQVRFLLLGTAVGLLPLVLLNLVPRLLGGSIPIVSSLSVLPLALVPAAFLASLTRYRLWDVEVLGRQTASLLGALLVGASFFALAQLLLAQPVAVGIPHARAALQVSAGLLMALSFGPVRRGLSTAFARFQYREAWRDREGLLALVRELPAPRALKDLQDLLADRVSRGLGVSRAALLPVAADALVARDVDGGPPLPLSELPAGARVRTTRLSRQDFTARPTAAVSRLRRAGFRTLAPLTVSGRLLALFAVGDRAGRVPLSVEDTELLETVLAPAALALDHARLFDELRVAGRPLPDAPALSRERRRRLGRGDRGHGRFGPFHVGQPRVRSSPRARRRVPRGHAGRGGAARRARFERRRPPGSRQTSARGRASSTSPSRPSPARVRDPAPASSSSMTPPRPRASNARSPTASASRPSARYRPASRTR